MKNKYIVSQNGNGQPEDGREIVNNRRIVPAPPERADMELIARQNRLFNSIPHLSEILGAIPDIIMALNSKRQIVYTNKSFDSFLTGNGAGAPLGKRPGEALGCIYAFNSQDGCGTEEFCSTCGAVRAILSSMHGESDVQECSITYTRQNDTFDLRVWANPLVIEGQKFTILTVADISHEKRRRSLEQIFFHDILNTAGGIRGIAELLQSPDNKDKEKLTQTLYSLSDKLIEEIYAQKELSEAENNELKAEPAMVNALEMLTGSAVTFKNQEISAGKEIVIDSGSWAGDLKTDENLLRRCILNLLKNALEASLPGQKIRISAARENDFAIFKVWNEAFIPKQRQLQIFQRSYSTKGSGRGLGTYSIKLLTEKYLNGSVSFESTPEGGTYFAITLPIK